MQVNGDACSVLVNEAIDNGGVAKVFNWIKAANIIKENPEKTWYAGLLEDWYWTSDIIWKNGHTTDCDELYPYSIWATPILMSTDNSEFIECWVPADEVDWDDDTKWPEEALNIINNK